MSTNTGWPNKNESRQLHANLQRGAATAPDAFATAFLNPLVRYLRRRYPWVPEEQHETAAADAMISLIRQPQNYNPNGGLSLGAYLRMAARADLWNLRQRELRHRRRTIPLKLVEDCPIDGNERESTGLVPGWDEPRLVAEIATFGKPEQVTFELMLTGERNTAAFAEALGLTDQARTEQAATVKRIKDRVLKRLISAARRIREAGGGT